MATLQTAIHSFRHVCVVESALYNMPIIASQARIPPVTDIAAFGGGRQDKVFMSLDHGDRRSDGSQNLGLNLGFVFYLPCELRESPNLCPYFTVQFSCSVVSNSL